MKRKTPLLSIVAGSLTLLSLIRRQKIKAEPHQNHANDARDQTEKAKESSPPIKLVRQTEEAQETEPAASHSQEQAKSAPKPRWTDKRLQTIFTGAIAVLTIILTGTAIVQWQTMNRQWRTMERQWETTEKAFKVSQKAYVGISNVQADFEGRRINLIVENIGQVPAEDIYLRVDVERDVKGGEGYPPNDPLEWKTYKLSTSFSPLFPATAKNIAVIPLNVTQEDVGLLRAGKQSLYVACWLEYADGFGNEEKHEFTFRYVPPPTEGWTQMSIYDSEDINETHRKEREKEQNKE